MSKRYSKDERTLLKKSMTKQELRNHDKLNRVKVDFNTGTRTHKSVKEYDRNKEKQEVERMINENITSTEKPHILILVGKSASGKDSIQRELIKLGYSPIVSTTSRPMLDGEKNGVDYNFISHAEFMDHIDAGDFLEYRAYNTLVNGKADTWYYGTQKIVPTEKMVTVLDLDGAKAYIDYYGKDICSVCYVYTEDRIREERAASRGSFDETEWKRRSVADAKDFSPVKLAKIVDYSVSNNTDNIQDAVTKVIRKERHMANEIQVTRENDVYVIKGNFKGTFGELCDEIEKQTKSGIVFDKDFLDPAPENEVDMEEER